jgi:hypothetical protein
LFEFAVHDGGQPPFESPDIGGFSVDRIILVGSVAHTTDVRQIGMHGLARDENEEY